MALGKGRSGQGSEKLPLEHSVSEVKSCKGLGAEHPKQEVSDMGNEFGKFQACQSVYCRPPGMPNEWESCVGNGKDWMETLS